MNLYLNKDLSEIKVFLFLLVFQITSIILLGLEYFKEAIVISLIFIACLGLLYPMLNVLILAFISLAIEGKLIENFILFRFLGFNWYLMDVAFFLVIVNLILMSKNSLENLIFDRTFAAVLVFLLVALYSVYNGLKNGHQFQGVFYDFRGFFYYLTFVPAIIYLNSKNKIITFLFFVLVIISLKSLVDIYFSLFVYEKTFDIESRQILGFARLTGYNEIVYSLSFIGAFFMFFLSNKFFDKIFAVLVFVISAFALFLSYTRGSWVAAVMTILVGIIFLVFSKGSKIKLKNVFISFLLLSLFFVILHLINLINLEVLWKRLQTISIYSIDISNLGRLVEYASALEAFRTNPISGTGLGYLFVYFSPGIGTVESIYCHNSYLYILSKMGIIGIIPFILLIIFALYPLLKIRKFVFYDYFYSISFILLLILLSIVIKSFTTWHLNTNTFSLFVGILFGVSIRIRDFLIKDYGR
ncbi:MAG: O-antigen ligase family protein [Candidatus Woesearchaeota archaeon]